MNMRYISLGTPGIAMMVARFTRAHTPGAVPHTLKIASAPFGMSACTRLRSGITRPRFANSS